MDTLEEIKQRADSWYDFMLSEVDKAVQAAWNDAAPAPQQKDISPH
ncbi:hypothetical protein EDC30_11169 [Paucimonas lemoignei]|uniref:Uncharacterized protein n=1 Tax=Paucimonas lemoignei TaxID=29443 RepID=A0A4R3HQW3_PAULE|nr:hypothetical protein [Paucimonas lemoignei]TCS35154.1 hypothetical protein EDC30_11169 [Paucimonas lemoignei]